MKKINIFFIIVFILWSVWSVFYIYKVEKTIENYKISNSEKIETLVYNTVFTRNYWPSYLNPDTGKKEVYAVGPPIEYEVRVRDVILMILDELDLKIEKIPEEIKRSKIILTKKEERL